MRHVCKKTHEKNTKSAYRNSSIDDFVQKKSSTQKIIFKNTCDIQFRLLLNIFFKNTFNRSRCISLWRLKWIGGGNLAYWQALLLWRIKRWHICLLKNRITHGSTIASKIFCKTDVPSCVYISVKLCGLLPAVIQFKRCPSTFFYVCLYIFS